MNAVEIIARKRDGVELTTEEIYSFVAGITTGEIPDYQASAWLMAVYFKGLSHRETLDLTLAMRDSGETIDLSDLPGLPAVDKHSTGGVGDKTTLVVVPLLAAAGVPVLKMSGRGLGYSGGTVDKLESIPGFRTDLSVAEAKGVLADAGAALIGQSAELAPADKALYALRDVTATVECIPLIVASIMSKKLAAGGRSIVLDVKCGSGAFMKTPESARALARELVRVGNGAGVPTNAVISSMEAPLGFMIGNALEVREAIETLLPDDELPGSECYFRRDPLFTDLCLTLAAHGLVANGVASSESKAKDLCFQILQSGAGARKLEKIIAAQGGPLTLSATLDALPVASETFDVLSDVAGFVTGINAETIGRVATEMGAGRFRKSDTIDPAAGIELLVKPGKSVQIGDGIARLHLKAGGGPGAAAFAARVGAAFTIAPVAQHVAMPRSLIIATIS